MTADSGTLVLRHDRDGVATLTLNRPEKLNALDAALMAELRAHLTAIASDESVGCVVLRGAGRCFSAGHDIGSTGKAQDGPDRYADAETVDLLEALPLPTVAAVHGYCFTGALELALGADLIVSTVSARLGDTHGQFGLVPVWGGAVRLPERVGTARAKDLMFTSRRIDGRTAEAYGLVDHAWPDEEFDTRLDALTAEIVANSWGTNRRVKRLLGLAASSPRGAALALERTRPWGLPEDSADRRAKGVKR